MKKVIGILVPPGLDSAVQGHPEDRISCGNGASSRPDNGENLSKLWDTSKCPMRSPLAFTVLDKKCLSCKK